MSKLYNVKPSKLSNYSSSLLTTRAYGLAVATATIKVGPVVLNRKHLSGGNIYL